MFRWLLLIPTLAALLALGCLPQPPGTFAMDDDDDDGDDDAADDDGGDDDGGDDDGADDDGGDDDNDPGPCSDHGDEVVWPDGTVCACDPGYTPSSPAGDDCVPTEQVCTGGSINFDYDGDGQTETWFDPTDDECWMFELVNWTRATHDPEGHPECHFPLLHDVEWSAHGRHHSMLMQQAGGLYHDDYPYAQNCAYGCDAACEMDMYMYGPDEPHCPDLSHHCNIMRCEISHIGIGTYPPNGGTWNTQNFF